MNWKLAAAALAVVLGFLVPMAVIRTNRPAGEQGERVVTAFGSFAKPGPDDAPFDTGLLKPYEIIDLAAVEPVQCPCGPARRGFAQPDNKVATLHMVDIKIDAETHHHKYLTEIYYFLECEDDAQMELNGKLYPVRPGMAVMIRPGTRHRAVGKMRILNVVVPPFNKNDEWLD